MDVRGARRTRRLVAPPRARHSDAQSPLAGHVAPSLHCCVRSVLASDFDGRDGRRHRVHHRHDIITTGQKRNRRLRLTRTFGMERSQVVTLTPAGVLRGKSASAAGSSRLPASGQASEWLFLTIAFGPPCFGCGPEVACERRDFLFSAHAGRGMPAKIVVSGTNLNAPVELTAAIGSLAKPALPRGGRSRSSIGKEQSGKECPRANVHANAQARRSSRPAPDSPLKPSSPGGSCMGSPQRASDRRLSCGEKSSLMDCRLLYDR